MNRANQILLRRRRKIIVEPGNGALPTTYIGTLLHGLSNLGFVCSPLLIETLKTLSEEEFVALRKDLLASCAKLVGADKTWEPMYPNFPQQVMDASDAELWVNAMMHYLGDVFGVRILPEYEKLERPKLVDELEKKKLRMIELGTEEELWEIGRNLMGAKTSISEADKADVMWFIGQNRDSLEKVLPTEIEHKENLVVVAKALIRLTDKADLVLTRYFRTATDVLRLAVGLSDGDVSLAKPSKFASFSRPQRRLLLAMVDRLDSPLEDMRKYEERWKRLGERLHPGEYRERFAKAAAAFDRVRAGDFPRTFDSHVEEALARKDIGRALDLVTKRPGVFARRLDHLLRLSDDPMAVVERFRGVADQVSTPVLLQAMAHFRARPELPDFRSFFPKGSVAKVFTIANELAPLDGEACQAIHDVCRGALVTRFAELEPLGKVWIAPELADHLVPFSQRSASTSLRSAVRGSRLPLTDAGTVRFFLWWKEGVVNDVPTGRIDVDLSAAVYTDDWRYLSHISFTNLRDSTIGAAHSGDITSAPNGACEFIDVPIEKARKAGARYLLMSVYAYTMTPFVDMPECFAGWMGRAEPQSGEVFEASTVEDRVDLTADSRICLPAMIDLKSREVIWMDMALTQMPGDWANTLESNERGMVHVAFAMENLVKPDVRTLLELHAQARGEVVADPAEADVRFEKELAFEADRVMAML